MAETEEAPSEPKIAVHPGDSKERSNIAFGKFGRLIGEKAKANYLFEEFWHKAINEIKTLTLHLHWAKITTKPCSRLKVGFKIEIQERVL